MLFSHHNGLSQPVTDDSISQLQELACGIGPKIDGVITSVMQPQAMGAFTTQGAAGACMLRNQQSEQHQPTTTTQRGFGGFGASIQLPSSTVANLTMIRAEAQPMRLLMPTDSGPPASAQPMDPYGPATPLPTTFTYPAGTITAFAAKTNMWRVAVPSVASGLGMIGAAAPFTEVAPVASAPAGATQVTEAELEKQTGQLPFYKKWQFWAAIGGSVAVVGTGAVLIKRKRTARAGW